MNKELYENIKNELNSLGEELATINYVGGHLLNEKLKGKSGKELFTVIYAFYEYMSQRKEFEFINNDGWAKFYRENLFDKIANNEKLLDDVLKVCSNEFKEKLYTYAKTENALHMKAGSNKYLSFYQRMEKVMVDEGLIEKKEKVIIAGDETNASIDKQIEELKEKKVQRRDVMFEEAADSIGLNKEKLIKKVGQNESFNVDEIVIDEKLVSKLAANSAIAATTPRNIFGKIIQKIKSSRHFKSINLKIDEIDGKKTLQLNKKKTVFDKIANSENALVRAIYNSAKEKFNLFKLLVKPSSEVKAAVSQMLLNASKKFNDFNSKNMGELKSMDKEFRESLSDLFHDIADKVSPNDTTVIQNDANSKIENKQTYFYTKDGRKVIVKSATKVGEVPPLEAVEQEKGLKIA